MRPRSIILFEQVYGASILCGLAATLLAWRATLAMLAANPITARFGQGFLIVTTLIGLGFALLLLYLIARRGSRIARWLLVVLAVLGTAQFLLAALLHRLSPGLIGMLGLLGTLLRVSAVGLLFGREARGWFAIRKGAEDES